MDRIKVFLNWLLRFGTINGALPTLIIRIIVALIIAFLVYISFFGMEVSKCQKIYYLSTADVRR